jgi:hypothetical protein
VAAKPPGPKTVNGEDERLTFLNSSAWVDDHRHDREPRRTAHVFLPASERPARRISRQNISEGLGAKQRSPILPMKKKMSSEKMLN